MILNTMTGTIVTTGTVTVAPTSSGGNAGQNQSVPTERPPLRRAPTGSSPPNGGGDDPPGGGGGIGSDNQDRDETKARAKKDKKEKKKAEREARRAERRDRSYQDFPGSSNRRPSFSMTFPNDDFGREQPLQQSRGSNYGVPQQSGTTGPNLQSQLTHHQVRGAESIPRGISPNDPCANVYRFTHLPTVRLRSLWGTASTSWWWPGRGSGAITSAAIWRYAQRRWWWRR